jgi:hypothetical protein
MKILPLIVGGLATAAVVKTTLFPCDGACPFSGGAAEPVVATADLAPRGDYLEARNVTVFGGHCHLNSEYDSQGDAAVVAWSIDAGVVDGVDLAGVRVVAALAADANLAEAPARASEVWIDAPGTASRAAAESWLRAEHGERLGAIAAVHAAPIAYERSGDGFAVYVDDFVALAGDALADRSCCTMPGQRGYEPLMAAAGAVVGNAARCSFEGTDALAGWVYEGANSVFLASFSSAADAPKSCCPSSRAGTLAP